jgi:adenosylhomocysteinase
MSFGEVQRIPQLAKLQETFHLTTMNLLFENRKKFFEKVANDIGNIPATQQIIITHFLPDRPELLDAFDAVSKIELLIAIPYSINQEILSQLREKYNVITPTLSQLRDQTFMMHAIEPVLTSNSDVRTIINEIGGYFAPFLEAIHSAFGDKLIGCIEDTQNGHVRYENARPLPYPVVSVARSSLKEGEDTLVGPSCYFSTERLLRMLGVLPTPRRALVVGYGKVGRGMAFCLQDNGCTASVYDINPIRNSVAQGDGMFIPDRNPALRNCDIVFGCTGVTSVSKEDFELLDDGCFLVSCSSKDVEFDLKGLNELYTKTIVAPGIEKFVANKGGKVLYLLGGGMPINFLDGAVFGPALTLVQSELIVALRAVTETVVSGEISEVGVDLRKQIAGEWQKAFIDPQTGSFPQ